MRKFLHNQNTSHGKKRSQIKRHHSLLATLLTLAVLSLTAAGIMILGIVNRSLTGFRVYVEDSEATETAGAADMLASDIATLQTSLYKHLSDDELLKIKVFISENIFNSRYEQSVKHLWALIQSVQSSLSLSVTVTLYLPDYNWFLTVDNAGTLKASEGLWVNSLIEHGTPQIFMESGQIYFTISNDVGIGQYGSNALAIARTQQYSMNRYLKQFEGEEGSSVFCLALDHLDAPVLIAQSHPLAEGLLDTDVLSLLQRGETGVTEAEAVGKRYLVTWKQVGALPLKLCQITPMEALDGQWKNYRIMTVVGYSIVMLILTLLILVTAHFIRQPIRRMDKAMRQLESGDFSTRIEPTWSNEFQQMFDQFHRMTEHMQRYIKQEYELRLLHSRAELKQLQYQISPHFLYNTYFTLRTMLMDEEYEQAEQLADLMGQYLRYITGSGQEYASLGEEIDHAEAYMRIQQIRFGKRVEAVFEPCPEEEKQLQVPKILIQPLIENAFEHGIRHQQEKGIIRVSFLSSTEEIRICVDDNGQNTTDAVIQEVRTRLLEGGNPDSSSVALINIHRRLLAACPEGSGVQVSRSPLGGFRSEITIRKESKTDSNDSNDDCG